MIPPTTTLARSQDRYESTVQEADALGWTPYRRRRSLWGGMWDSYWEYQSLKWSLGGLGLAAGGVFALFSPGLFWGGLILIGIGALWTYLVFRPRRRTSFRGR